MLKLRKHQLLVALAALFILSPALPAASPTQTAKDMVEQMPAPNPEKGRQLAATVIDAGPGAVAQVCEMLTPPGVGDDSKARFAVQQLSVYAGRPNAEEDQKMYANSLADALHEVSDKEVKAFLIRQLEFVGQDEVVDDLAKYLSDERLCDTAAQTLQTIATEKAVSVLEEALPDASGARRVTLVKALGTLRCKGAVDEILPHTSSADTRLRRTALWAVANIGPVKGIQHPVKRALSKATETTDTYEKAKATSYYLLYAERLAEAGKAAECAEMCRELIETREEINVHSAALGTLVDAVGKDALPDLVKAAQSESDKLQAAALGFARELPGKNVTRRFVKLMESADTGLRAEIVEMLGERGDDSALPDVLKALEDDSQRVQLAAVRAAGQLGKGDAASALIETLTSAEPDVAEAAKSALMRLPAGAVCSKAAGALSGAEPAAQVTLLELLSERKATGQKSAVFELAESENDKVRAAALKSLGDVAEPADMSRLLTLLAEAPDGSSESAARQAIIAVSENISETQKRSKEALKSLEGASAEQRARLLAVFPHIGGEEALIAAATHMTHSNSDVRAAAIRALGNWSDIEAALHLLNAAHKADDAKHRLLAVRGAIQVVGNSDVSNDKKMDVYRSILLAAERAQEKRMALSGLSNIRTVESLILVAKQVEDESIRREAARAAISIACPRNKNDRGLVAPGVAIPLREVAQATDNPDLRKKASQHLHTLAEELRQKAEDYSSKDLYPIFNGEDLTGWMGDTGHYKVEDGKIVCPAQGGGNLLTKAQYSDFVLRFQFKLEPGANNGLAIRTPSRGNPAFAGMELQILDNKADKYQNLRSYQYHGSIYGVVPSKRGHLKPAGEWNTQEVIAIGPWVTVNLNGETILNANIDEAAAPKPMDGRDHPGLKRQKGHIGFMGHGARLEFRNLRIKDLSGDALPADPGAERTLNEPPPGFNALFNGRNLTGWKGLVGNPKSRAKMKPLELAKKQINANEGMRTHWQVKDGALVFDGKGHSLCTIRDYRNFEMLVDWKIERGGDSGIYLRGAPQVQIWDPKDHPEGSGGLYNNKKHPSKPLTRADNPVGQWNTFRIRMVDERVTVHLNDELVVDDTVMENYWDRSRPIYEWGQIELQSHGSTLYFRNVFLRELPENPSDGE